MDLDAAVDRLKHLDRAGWVLAGHDAPESVAAHSWGMAVRCLQHCPDDLDLATVLSMALVHDLAEAVVGDITPHDGVDKAEKHAKERAAMASIAPQWLEFWDAYEAGDSPEAVFVKRMDSLGHGRAGHRLRRPRSPRRRALCGLGGTPVGGNPMVDGFLRRGRCRPPRVP